MLVSIKAFIHSYVMSLVRAPYKSAGFGFVLTFRILVVLYSEWLDP